jgi:hypothetical protein
MNNKGFIALITAIIISLVLLSAALSAGLAAFEVLDQTIGTASKMQSELSVEGCLMHVLSMIGENQTFATSSGLLSVPVLPATQCTFSVIPSGNQSAIIVQSASSAYSTKISAVIVLPGFTYIKYEESSP